MSLPDETHQELRGTVEEWMRSKNIAACPACGEASWSFDRMDLIVPLAASTVRIIAGDQGTRGRTQEADLSRLREMRRIFGNLRALVYQWVKLPCDNCGYVLLLDAGKVHGLHDADDEG